MAYQVFARKYRPQTFREIIGQEAVVRSLTNALRLGRIAQAYLFVGPRGTGKTSTARILAKALEAPNGPSAEFDPSEGTAKEIAEGRFLDVLEIDGASNNGVEQVRDLRDNVMYAPAKGRFKIYIIDEVHMLSTAAFNALLKTLEEPPSHVKFIFATTEVHKLPATILSRCQRFDLRRIPEAMIRAHLAHICALEGVEAEPGALDALARHAEGGMRDAEGALDQAISFYGDRVSEADVHALFGLTGFGPVANLGRALASGNAGEVLRMARELISAGKDLGKLSQDLLAFFRNLVIFQVSPEALEKELTVAEARSLGEVSKMITRGAALDVLNELSQLESRLRYALAKDVIFEVALIQMSQLREKVSLERVLEAIEGAGLPPSTAKPAPKIEPPSSTLKEVRPGESLPEARPLPELPAVVEPKPQPIAPTPPASVVLPVIESPQPIVTAPAPVLAHPVVEPTIESTTILPVAPIVALVEQKPPPPKAEVKPEPILPKLEPEPIATMSDGDLPEEMDEERSPFSREADLIPAAFEAPMSVTPPAPAPSGYIKESEAEAAWLAAVERFATERPVEADTIRAVEFMAAKGETVEVSLPTPLSKKIHYLRSPRNLQLLEATLKERLGRAVQVVFLITTPKQSEATTETSPIDAAVPGKPVPPAPTMSKEEFLNDPAILHALQIFEAKLTPNKR